MCVYVDRQSVYQLASSGATPDPPHLWHLGHGRMEAAKSLPQLSNTLYTGLLICLAGDDLNVCGFL